MQIAIITATNEQVEITAVKGGWSTIRATNSLVRFERKVRNSALSGHAEITAQKAPTTAKLVAEKLAKPAVTVEAVQEGRKNGVVFAGYLPQYEAYAAKRADGTTKRSIDKGDNVAVLLRNLDLGDVYDTVSSATGTSVADLFHRFGHLNPGMQRMNLGNMMRRALREAAAATA
jgi:hypothetical protein